MITAALANDQYMAYTYAEFPRADWTTDSMAKCNQRAWATGQGLTNQEVMRD